jgi:uncharacterized protein YwqG
MQTDDLLTKLAPWRERHQRAAWKPQVLAKEPDSPVSKFGGRPWLKPDEGWLTCGSCNQPLTFFLQLDLEALPSALNAHFGFGLLQLFYCTECDDGYEPFSETHHTRIVERDHLTSQERLLSATTEFPAKEIVAWQEIIDLPSPEEFEELGLKIDYDFEAKTVSIDCSEIGLSIVRPFAEDEDTAEQIANPTGGDKLAGWPAWVQGAEYPLCPECSRRMRLLLQLDSNDNIPFIFGDVGTGHITQCPDHHHTVTFA